MIIISVIDRNGGKLLHQYLAEKENGFECYLNLLRSYEASGYMICAGDLVAEYQLGLVTVKRDDSRYAIYINEREVI